MVEFNNYSNPDSGNPESEPTVSSFHRRRFIGGLGLAAAGLVVSASPAHAFFGIFKSRSDSEILASCGIPPEWIKTLGRGLPEYCEFIAKLRLKGITVRQVVEPHLRKRGQIQNTLPPKALWKNIRKTLLVTDRVAKAVGEPVSDLISVYRSPAYNAACPGAKSRSMHTQNLAVDVRFRTSPRHVSNAARVLRMQGLFEGGVGRYSSFTHIDTRGSNADW